MSLFPSLTREVDVAPQGPDQVAFFDLDRTLIDGYSVMAFMREALSSGLLGPGRLIDQARAALEGRGDFGLLLEKLIGTLEGEMEADLIALGRRTFDTHLAGRIHPEARALVQAHRARGHRVVIVSSATAYQAEPVAQALGIDPEDVLCTRLVVDRFGRLTGKWHLPGCWQEGKRMHARLWLRRNGLRFEDAWFYTDSIEDVSLLDRVARPRPVNPDPRLADEARRQGWPLLRFRARRPSVEGVVRTGLALSGTWGAMLAGATTLALGGRMRDAIDVATSTFGELGLTLGGVRLRVHGEEHLRAARPAVAVFNHQSLLDGMIVARLLRSDFTALAKRELADDPLLGPALRAAGLIFIDREAPRSGMQLGPALEALEHGLTLAVAPEGTRSATTLPGPFKRGALYLAKRARVPLLPIVIHNSVDALPRGGVFLRPNTTVEVTVLPPLDPAGWRMRDLDAHADALRERYLEVLGFRAPPAAVVEPMEQPAVAAR